METGSCSFPCWEGRAGWQRRGITDRETDESEDAKFSISDSCRVRSFRERGTNIWQRKAVLLGNSWTILKKKKKPVSNGRKLF